MIIIPAQNGTYRHLRTRVADLLAESSQTRCCADRLNPPGLPGREVTAGIYRSAEPGVNRLDGVCRADHRPYLPVESQERDKFCPCVLPESYDSGVAFLPLAGELGEQVERPGLGRRGVNRLEIFGDLCPVPFRGVLK